ncbi:hypothetical protein LPTSP3_g22940 [Leptospira kobayashii]|uniref:Uncharacterized protein n=1 Tax=Leptospira kobayashii TaxID=1917830 RepID=A0ABM7USR5_9LEPT|nr:hypothetical protein [Leptospira kobayashii]BDA79364.1 hypothetical protein LPTSP3_g22940 [Leptospira kobayashii]
MALSIRLPLFLSLLFFGVNFVLCAWTHMEKPEGPFRLGDAIIRYAEELEKFDSKPSYTKLTPHHSNLL